jgi:hypothetical protein
MTSYPNFSLYIIPFCLETRQTCHIVSNHTSTDLIVVVLPTTQATEILPVICQRFPSDLASPSSGHFTSTLLKPIRQFSHITARRSSLLRLKARHSGRLRFSDGDWAAFFLAIPAGNRRGTMKTFAMMTIVIREEATAWPNWRPRR